MNDMHPHSLANLARALEARQRHEIEEVNNRAPRTGDRVSDERRRYPMSAPHIPAKIRPEKRVLYLELHRVFVFGPIPATTTTTDDDIRNEQPR